MLAIGLTSGLGSTLGCSLDFIIDVSKDLFGWLLGWVGWVGWVASFVGYYFFTGATYYFGALLGIGFIPPPKRRSSISFSKLVFFLLASRDCFSYLTGYSSS